MKKNIKKIVLFSLVILSGAFAWNIYAQTQLPIVPPPVGGPTPISGPDEAIALLRKIFQWFAIIFWILAVGAIFYAGFKYLTSQGDENKVKSANAALKYAIIAIVIGIIAYGVPTFVDQFLRGRA